MVDMVPTAINERWTLLLPEHRAARPEWPYWEKERLASMYDHLGPGDVVYDIGAEEGDLPALWATWGASVYLVEPNPRVWPNIRAIWNANALAPPLGWFVGFAGQEDYSPPNPSPWFPNGYAVPFDGWPQCAYGPLIGDHGFLNICERPDVGAVKIDTIAAQVGPPTAITMDIEGAELIALRGASKVLREHRPLVWVSVHPEFSVQMYGVTREDVLEYMDQHEYNDELLAIDHEHHYFFSPR